VGSVWWREWGRYGGQIFFTTTREIQLNGVALQVIICLDDPPQHTWRVWKLVPVKVDGVFATSQLLSETLGSGSLPSYDGGETGQSSTRAQHVESEHDEFGTVVTEVTTTVVTTRKRYRVEDA